MISIIIPCYNSEKYIIRNLDSLIRQTNKNFKVYFIDDGSTDNTVNVIKKKLENTLVNYEIYVREHQGVGAARNFGIKNAETPYIMFLDSDDYLKDNCIEIFIKEIQQDQSDIIIGEYEHEYNNEIVWKYSDIYLELNENLNASKVLNLILDNKIHVCTSNAVYKRELYNNKNFHDTCMYHEDLNMWYKVINISQNIKIINDTVFIYVIRDNSISHNLSVEKLKQGIFMLEELSDELKHDGVSQEILEKIQHKTIPNICYIFFNGLCLDNKNIIKIYKENKYFYVMRNATLENIGVKALLKYFRILMIGYFPWTYRIFWQLYQRRIKPLILLRR